MTPDDEVLTGGGPLWQPPRALVVAVAIAVVAGFGGWRLLKPAHRPGPAPAAITAPAPDPQPARDDRLTPGRLTGTRLVLAGRSLVDIGVDDGSARRTPLPGWAITSIHVRGGDVVLVADAPDRLPAAVFVPLDRGRIVPLAPARGIIPAADDEHVWLAESATATGALWKVDLSGRLELAVDLGRGRAAVRETSYGMVTVLTNDFSSSLELWDVTTRKVRRVDWVAANFVVAASDPEHTAFTLPGCDRPDCPVQIVTTRTGTVGGVVTPTGWATGAVSFSPDGSRLAILGRRTSRAEPDEPMLVVADLPAGTVLYAGGVRPALPRSALTAWSRDGNWFFLAAAKAPGDFLDYRLGERTVRYVADPRLQLGLEPAELTGLSAY